MVSLGHDPQVLPSYSLDKLELYYHTAQKRLAKERTRGELLIMQAAYMAMAGIHGDKKSQSNYRRHESELVAAVNDTAKDQVANQQTVARRLKSMGARSSGRKH